MVSWTYSAKYLREKNKTNSVQLLLELEEGTVHSTSLTATSTLKSKPCNDHTKRNFEQIFLTNTKKVTKLNKKNNALQCVQEKHAKLGVGTIRGLMNLEGLHYLV